jgi:hypothetical protein
MNRTKDFEEYIVHNLPHHEPIPIPTRPSLTDKPLAPVEVLSPALEITRPSVTTATPTEGPECPNIDRLEYWKKKASPKDLAYVPPLKKVGPSPKYVSFEPDVGGWNNIRMQMETVLVFAAATGRTLVLPPDQPMYLLDKGKGHENAHHFSDFFPFERIAQDHVADYISMDEFLSREAITNGLAVTSYSWETFYKKEGGVRDLWPMNETSKEPPGTILRPHKANFDATDREERKIMWAYLRKVGACPDWEPFRDFVLIPSQATPSSNPYFKWRNLTKDLIRLNAFSAGRKVAEYDEKWQKEKLIHFISLPGFGFRLLTHFYTMIYFEDEWADRFYKRVVR